MFNEMTRIRTLLIALMLALLTIPVMGQVRGVSGVASVSNTVEAIQPPASLANGNLESDTRAFIFLERENVTLDQNVTLDYTVPGRYSLDFSSRTPETIRSGTQVNSYLIHFDPEDRFSGDPFSSLLAGQVTFEQEILGFITVRENLISTSGRLGSPNTNYQDLSGLEFVRVDLEPKDEMFFEANRRTIRFEFRDRTEIDQMRVITASESTTPPSDGGGSGSGNQNTPVARNESASTNEDRSVTIDVLSNDTDADDNIDRSSLRVTKAPLDGTATINSTSREVTYRPDNNFSGSDSFEYEVWRYN